MALVVEANPLLNTANSYCTLVFAESHHYSRLHNDDWATASETTKNAALVWATSILEQLEWEGTKVEGDYPLRFPRENMYNRDKQLMVSTTVPVDIQKGCAELALFLIREDRTEGLDNIQADTLQIGSVGMRKLKYNKFPPAVLSYITPYLSTFSSFQAKVQRV